jgi:hypothetical protein
VSRRRSGGLVRPGRQPGQEASQLFSKTPRCAQTDFIVHVDLTLSNTLPVSSWHFVHWACLRRADFFVESLVSVHERSLPSQRLLHRPAQSDARPESCAGLSRYIPPASERIPVYSGYLDLAEDLAQPSGIENCTGLPVDWAVYLPALVVNLSSVRLHRIDGARKTHKDTN